MAGNPTDELSIDKLLANCETNLQQKPIDESESDLADTGTFPVAETLLAPEMIFSKEDLHCTPLQGIQEGTDNLSRRERQYPDEETQE